MELYLVTFDKKFRQLSERSIAIIDKTPAARLFWQPVERAALFPVNSCGEYILRSAGKIEQTFGGITTKLWDDPFEWTLPEHLSSSTLIIEYLQEVEETRKKAFNFFRADEDLKKSIPAPVKIVPLFEILLDTVTVAENYLGRAIAVFRQFSDEKLF
jgi:hypothetical protein